MVVKRLSKIIHRYAEIYAGARVIFDIYNEDLILEDSASIKVKKSCQAEKKHIDHFLA